jgi:hypothetical protein
MSLHPQDVERLVAYVQTCDRTALLAHFHSSPAPFPLDFTDAFLSSLPIDRLRHLFLALCLHSKYVPSDALAPNLAQASAPAATLTGQTSQSDYSPQTDFASQRTAATKSAFSK